ncbi:hypothetical protein A3C87_00815 [Candidatus Kaiserbacteria bacterium RIFCSPHIGHO2_02_FULL_49_34]|uniref:Major facilitator superfamily (MFS) profile domain-containing protein n=1 Tax=Candidatus Kaiserbacteria bacterium RIFCSPHIGHO2_02_FULL_49_34 TaxID=1798491 RepID=A0A1F6DLN8_9BACT|nr:MAG: hypothetical protein A3C87_00815 [Candidatus Kaiserbacteria bacterium RIFCSPHIGHO2_02_FULL_49_34]
MTFTTKALLFTSGFVILALQFLGIRVLGPVAGVTTPVWAMLIAVALSGSAVGYYLGGKLADRLPSAKLHVVFLMGATLSLVAVPYMQGGVLWLLAGFSPLFITAVAASLLFVMPIACLAALTTYVIRLHVKSLDTVAQVHGDFFAWATVGSVVGTFVVTYVLIPAMATSAIFTLLGVSVAAVGFLALFRE